MTESIKVNIVCNKKSARDFSLTDLFFYRNSPPYATNSGANTRDTTVISLIRILREGPDVSLNGSPTVSPVTAAL